MNKELFIEERLPIWKNWKRYLQHHPERLSEEGEGLAFVVQILEEMGFESYDGERGKVVSLSENPKEAYSFPIYIEEKNGRRYYRHDDITALLILCDRISEGDLETLDIKVEITPTFLTTKDMGDSAFERLLEEMKKIL